MRWWLPAAAMTLSCSPEYEGVSRLWCFCDAAALEEKGYSNVIVDGAVCGDGCCGRAPGKWFEAKAPSGAWVRGQVCCGNPGECVVRSGR